MKNQFWLKTEGSFLNSSRHCPLHIVGHSFHFFLLYAIVWVGGDIFSFLHWVGGWRYWPPDGTGKEGALPLSANTPHIRWLSNWRQKYPATSMEPRVPLELDFLGEFTTLTDPHTHSQLNLDHLKKILQVASQKYDSYRISWTETFSLKFPGIWFVVSVNNLHIFDNRRKDTHSHYILPMLVLSSSNFLTRITPNWFWRGTENSWTSEAESGCCARSEKRFDVNVCRPILPDCFTLTEVPFPNKHFLTVSPFQNSVTSKVPPAAFTFTESAIFQYTQHFFLTNMKNWNKWNWNMKLLLGNTYRKFNFENKI